MSRPLQPLPFARPPVTDGHAPAALIKGPSRYVPPPGLPSATPLPAYCAGPPRARVLPQPPLPPDNRRTAARTATHIVVDGVPQGGLETTRRPAHSRSSVPRTANPPHAPPPPPCRPPQPRKPQLIPPPPPRARPPSQPDRPSRDLRPLTLQTHRDATRLPPPLIASPAPPSGLASAALE